MEPTGTSCVRMAAARAAWARLLCAHGGCAGSMGPTAVCAWQLCGHHMPGRCVRMAAVRAAWARPLCAQHVPGSCGHMAAVRAACTGLQLRMQHGPCSRAWQLCVHAAASHALACMRVSCLRHAGARGCMRAAMQQAIQHACCRAHPPALINCPTLCHSRAGGVLPAVIREDLHAAGDAVDPDPAAPHVCGRGGLIFPGGAPAARKRAPGLCSITNSGAGAAACCVELRAAQQTL